MAEAEFRAGGIFKRAKSVMLALYGVELLVLDVLELEASDSDVASHILRWVNYTEVSPALWSAQASSRTTSANLGAIWLVACTNVAAVLKLSQWPVLQHDQVQGFCVSVQNAPSIRVPLCDTTLTEPFGPAGAFLSQVTASHPKCCLLSLATCSP